MSNNEPDAALEQWASDPSKWGEPSGVLTGDAAAAFGRATLEAAGVDVAALERRVGRPRLDGKSDEAGTRSPRVNVAITETQRELLDRATR